VLEGVERALGFRVSQIQQDGSVIIKGKKIDPKRLLPGNDVFGLGWYDNPSNLLDPKFNRLKATLANVLNVELADRSGAAVTTGEYDRFKNEWSANRWNNKAGFLTSLKRFTSNIDRALENFLSAYTEPAVSAIYNRGVRHFRTGYTPKNPRLIKILGGQAKETPAANLTSGQKVKVKFRNLKTGEFYTTDDPDKITRARNNKALFEEVK
jgi:hypothetical protein